MPMLHSTNMFNYTINNMINININKYDKSKKIHVYKYFILILY